MYLKDDRVTARCALCYAWWSKNRYASFIFLQWTVKQSLKSVYIFGIYRKIKTGPLFGPLGIWVPWKFSGVTDYAHGYTFPDILMGFSIPSDAMNTHTKFEVRSFTCSWDNGTLKFGQFDSGYAHATFSPKFLMGFCSDGAVNVPANLKPISLGVSMQVLLKVPAIISQERVKLYRHETSNLAGTFSESIRTKSH